MHPVADDAADGDAPDTMDLTETEDAGDAVDLVGESEPEFAGEGGGDVDEEPAANACGGSRDLLREAGAVPEDRPSEAWATG